MSNSRVELGVFGKIPSYPEFISRGARSPLVRAFERWSEMANDQVARGGGELPAGPIGFCFRDETANAQLVGVLVGSRDEVGRSFPLSLFCEWASSETVKASTLAEAFRPALGHLSELALKADASTREQIESELETTPLPSAADIQASRAANAQLMGNVCMNDVFARVFSGPETCAYALQTIARACDQSMRNGSARALALGVPVSSDLELAFWLATTEARLDAQHGPLSVFWDVNARRAIVIPGVPDSSLLVSLASEQLINTPRLWNTHTRSQAALDAAWSGLSPELRERLLHPAAYKVSELVEDFANR